MTLTGKLQKIETTLVTRLAAEQHHAGIADIVNGLATTRLLPPANLKEPFTAREYVRIIQLTTSESMTLGRFASDAFTAIDKAKPTKGRTFVHRGKRLYLHRDLQAWAIVYESWLSAR